MNIPTVQPMLGAQNVKRDNLIGDEYELKIEEEKPKDEPLKIPKKDLKHKDKAPDIQTQQLIDLKNSIVPYANLVEDQEVQSNFQANLEQAMRDIDSIQYALGPKKDEVTDQDPIDQLQSTIKANLD